MVFRSFVERTALIAASFVVLGTLPILICAELVQAAPQEPTAPVPDLPSKPHPRSVVSPPRPPVRLPPGFVPDTSDQTAASKSAAESFNSQPAAGTLRTIGAYPSNVNGHTVAGLPDGTIFIYGTESFDFQHGQEIQRLRNRRAGMGTGVFFEALAWIPSHHGWTEIPQPPECHGQSYLHTMTALPNGKVLVAGGLCDEAKFGNDPTPNAIYKKLSLWDGATQKWEAAPSLAFPRIFHTANLLRDGSVMFVGGESDPTLAGTDASEVVLNSVESYQSGKVVQLEALNTARARHTATELADGSVLVVGGYAAEGNPLAGTEIWNPGNGAWSKGPSMTIARYNHTATLLDDGRVLVAGGIGAQGRALASVEIFDPRTSTWSATDSLPMFLEGHAALRVAEGVLVAGGGNQLTSELSNWAFLWDKATAKWRPAGMATLNDMMALKYKPTLIPGKDGTVLVFTLRNIMQWRSASLAANEDAGVPHWERTPAAAKLADGTMMFIAQIKSGSEYGWKSYIWNPSTNAWADAGSLAYRAGFTTQAIQLPSGRVLHLGREEDNRYSCESWTAQRRTWESCGGFKPDNPINSGAGLGLLADGRAVLIAATDEGYLFDEGAGKWKPTRVRWHREGLTPGSPPRTGNALAEVYDDASGQWFDISDTGSRYWQLAEGQTGRPPHLLWDPRKKSAAFFFQDDTMGTNAYFLPDGCAISTEPYSIFNPVTKRAEAITDPGVGILQGFRKTLVLDDGTVVIAGAQATSGTGFFHRKASCAGFEKTAADDVLMPAVFYDPRAAAQALADAKGPPATPESETSNASWWDAWKDRAWWIEVLVAGVLGYVLLVRALPPVMKRLRAVKQEGLSTLQRRFGYLLIAVSIVAQCKIMLALRAEYGHHAAAQAGLQLLFLAIATPGAVIALLFAADALVKFKRGETNFKSVASYGAIALAPVVFYLAALLWPQPESPAPVAVPIVLQHFELHEAEAYDPQTRLTWARCSVGQEYSPTGSCLGKVSMMSQWDAVRQHDGDWRVPTLDELSTLLEPFIGIDAKAFPNMDANAQFYCATQPGTGSLDDSVRMVNFVSLQIFQNGSSNYCSVRLVKRKAEPPWDVATAGKYYDAKTDLTWARCSAGQSWVAHFGCFGVVKLLTWEDAQRQADSPWRLPTKDELLTLVDKSAKGPLKINADTFPDMNRAIPAYWTGDQDEANSRPDMTMMFGVYFEQGVAGGLIQSGTLAAVRLVKSGK